ncbi:hypothetical protein EVAR_51878_1 [Eumeta japonica]|uniref:Uncharacterized protein n=1 Tax=Eumeta variegata TaxID=151549 RepID=A0A4C1YLX8_EUMVA|nr:hypothetical protein EVAR_51878_1 [Eumeta japonica]
MTPTPLPDARPFFRICHAGRRALCRISNHGRKGDTSAARVKPIAIGAPPVMESPGHRAKQPSRRLLQRRAEAELARASLENREAESALSENDAASQIDKAAMVKGGLKSTPEEYEALPPITAPPAPAAHT